MTRMVRKLNPERWRFAVDLAHGCANRIACRAWRSPRVPNKELMAWHIWDGSGRAVLSRYETTRFFSSRPLPNRSSAWEPCC